MTSGLNVNSEELSTYIKSVLNGISQGITSGYTLNNSIKFQVEISNEVKIDGGVKVIIAHVGAGETSNKNAKIEFEITSEELRNAR